VRSSSFRLASRISNLLGAGHPVEGLEEISKCSVILIRMPEAWIEPVVDELADSIADWKSKTVLLCDRKLDSSVLHKLAFLGASTGSLAPLASAGDPVFVVEGHRRALREARLLVAEPGTRVVSMDRGRKALFGASVSFATSLALPLLAATVETMRACGIEQNDALFLAERLMQKTIRAYLKGGRKGWEGALPMQQKEELRSQLQALLRFNPLLASYFFENSVLVTQIFRQDPNWLRELEPPEYAQAASQ
jgi:hypothetical protein